MFKAFWVNALGLDNVLHSDLLNETITERTEKCLSLKLKMMTEDNGELQLQLVLQLIY